MKTVTTWTNGDVPVKLEQSEASKKLFRVTYGKQVSTMLTYAEATKEFGECVFHSLACAGLLDNSGS